MSLREIVIAFAAGMPLWLAALDPAADGLLVVAVPLPSLLALI